MPQETEIRSSKLKQRSRSSLIALIAVIIFAVAGAVLGIAIYRAEPILQARIIETLSARFHSRVELAGFNVSVAHGLQVTGEGLKIFGATDLNTHEPGIQPLIAIKEFRFTASILNLLHTPMRVHHIYLNGLELNVPPKEQPPSGGEGLKPGKIKINVDEFHCEQARLVINTLKPGKLPLAKD